MATYYINADTGNDGTGSGTSGSPWLTLAKAYASSTSGDTIYLQTSVATYSWASADMASYRILQGQSATGAVFDAASGNVAWGLGPSWSFVNLTFQNNQFSTAAGYYCPIGQKTGLGAAGTTTFVGCRFRNITLLTDGQHVGAVGSKSLADCSYALTGCLFHNVVGTVGMTLTGLFPGSVATAYSLTNCTLAWAPNSVPVPAVFGGFAARITSATLKNSIVYNGSGRTLLWQSAANPIILQTVTYCDFYLVTGSPAGTGNITSDPLFIDPGNGNLNLRPGSPCIDTGTSV